MCRTLLNFKKDQVKAFGGVQGHVKRNSWPVIPRHRTPKKSLCGAGEDVEQTHGVAWRAWVMKQVFHLNCVVSEDHVKKSNVWQTCRKQAWGTNISEDPSAALKEPSCGKRREKDGTRRC